MQRLEGKTALITGAARGQGRAHAVRMAEEGANLVVVDICKEGDPIAYQLATSADLAETADQVLAAGGKVLSREGDVRDEDAMTDIVVEAVGQFGGIDIVCSNAGIVGYNSLWQLSREEWDAVIGTNLTGHWCVLKAVLPQMIERGRGGSVIMTGSAVATKAMTQSVHYVASKHGLLGLVKAAALELAPHRIRVNMVNPGGVATAMVDNPATRRRFRPDLDDPTLEDMAQVASTLNPMGVAFLEPRDVTEAIMYFASDESRFVTGAALAVDLGMAIS
ncbi:MAG TPA: mycofactocin-coupled SDR family oxidoreductase [Acidimicrobiales bacterium]|nr:mycofactocin-coupled SDR family oxidoreductase [Acidimicrobiales bacterium]